MELLHTGMQVEVIAGNITYGTEMHVAVMAWNILLACRLRLWHDIFHIGIQDEARHDPSLIFPVFLMSHIRMQYYIQNIVLIRLV